MIKKEDFMNEALLELGNQEFKNLKAGLDNDYYSMVESHVKSGKTIDKKVYDSLSDGQKFHFNKHYNHSQNIVVTKRYEDSINALESIKTNLLDPNGDSEITEKINDLINDMESYELICRTDREKGSVE